jgi:hypothetical protein
MGAYAKGKRELAPRRAVEIHMQTSRISCGKSTDQKGDQRPPISAAAVLGWFILSWSIWIELVTL